MDNKEIVVLKNLLKEEYGRHRLPVRPYLRFYSTGRTTGDGPSPLYAPLNEAIEKHCTIIDWIGPTKTSVLKLVFGPDVEGLKRWVSTMLVKKPLTFMCEVLIPNQDGTIRTTSEHLVNKFHYDTERVSFDESLCGERSTQLDFEIVFFAEQSDSSRTEYLINLMPLVDLNSIKATTQHVSVLRFVEWAEVNKVNINNYKLAEKEVPLFLKSTEIQQ